MLSDKHVLFTSAHCKACPAMRQNLLTAGISFSVVSVDTPEGAREAQKYRIMSLPSLLLMHNGLPYKVLTGAYTPAQLVEKLT